MIKIVVTDPPGTCFGSFIEKKISKIACKYWTFWHLQNKSLITTVEQTAELSVKTCVSLSDSIFLNI